jgi:hypothetical protein
MQSLNDLVASYGYAPSVAAPSSKAILPTRTGRTIVDITSGTTLSVAQPPEMQVGDWAICVLSIINVTTTITPNQTGWVALVPQRDDGTRRSYVYARKITASDPAIFTFTVSASTAVKAVLFGGSGGVDPSQWIVGAVTSRSASGGTTSNTAVAITTAQANTEIIIISVEATSATESAVSSITGATEWFFAPEGGSGGSSINTVEVAYIDKVAAGATGAVTITYPNTQAANGFALQIGIPPVDSLSYSLDTLPPFWYIAHRGLSKTYPEMTQYAYDQAVRKGLPALEVSVFRSSDGTFWCTHDQNLLRETGNNVSINTTSDATLSGYSVLGSLTDTAQSNRPMTKLVDVLNAYAGSRVIFIEDKTYTNQAALLTILQGYPDYQKHFIWKQYGDANVFSGVATAGLRTWGYFFDTDMAAFASRQAQFDYVGLDYNSSDATLNSAITTAGAQRVIGQIIQDTTQRDRFIAKGVKGLVVSRLSVLPGIL